MTSVLDVAIVGGGYRAVSFLASAPWLLQRHITVFERSDSFGGGAFADYDCTSTSVANRFVKWVSDDLADRVGDIGRLRRLRRPDAEVTPLPLRAVAEVMEDIGGAVEAAMGRTATVRRRDPVNSIEVVADSTIVHSASGSVRARHVVLATGRYERAHQELALWRTKSILSSHLISRARVDAITSAIGRVTGPIVIAGSSHSAIAALSLVLRIRDSVNRPDLPVVILQRSGARLHYLDLATAYRDHSPSIEAPIDPVTDVCPGTGQVNRDSGLRGAGRRLYLSAAAGGLPHVSIRRIARLAEATEVLDSAGLVVQALGYHGRVPQLNLPGGRIRRTDSRSPLINLADGTVVVDGQPFENLSALRVEPTPFALRDHGMYGQDLYPRLQARLSRILGAT